MVDFLERPRHQDVSPAHASQASERRHAEALAGREQLRVSVGERARTAIG
jgi:hypothetical protein